MGDRASDDPAQSPGDPSATAGIGAADAASDGNDPKKTDTLRSWYLCAVITILLTGGSVGGRTAGTILVSIAGEFGVSKGQAMWPITVQNLCISLSSESRLRSP